MITYKHEKPERFGLKVLTQIKEENDMNLQKHVDGRNLVLIECALNILLKVDVENSQEIDTQDFTKVEVWLRTWQQELFEKIIKKVEKDESTPALEKKEVDNGK